MVNGKLGESRPSRVGEAVGELVEGEVLDPNGGCWGDAILRRLGCEDDRWVEVDVVLKCDERQDGFVLFVGFVRFW